MFNLDNLDSKWKEIIKNEMKKDYFLNIINSIENDLKDWKNIFPSKENIFKAFELTKFDNLKVVILWQDPYHWANQAHWLSFSVQDDIKLPPSLRNIYKELQNDLWILPDQNWNLTSWAKSWVLLLNATLTVIEKTPNSHAKIGWQTFSDNIIKEISNNLENIVFILWWDFAQKKEVLIDTKKHYVLRSAHPSPFSAHRWFFWSKVFSQTNKFLTKIWKEEINWKL